MAESYVLDPFAEGYAADPYPEYARLRDDGPVHEHPLGFRDLLVQRFPGLSLAGDVVWNGRINLRGVETLPVAV
jgi:hypothetical protein